MRVAVSFLVFITDKIHYYIQYRLTLRLQIPGFPKRYDNCF